MGALLVGVLLAGTAPDDLVRFSVVETRVGARGMPAPAVAGVKQLDGALVDVDLKSGLPTLVSFWATWCAPCLEEIPELAALAREHAGRLHVVALACDSPHREVMATVEQRQIRYRVLEAPDAVARAWGVTAFPTSFLVDGQGVVRWSDTGAVSAAEVVQQLTDLNGLAALPPGAALLPGEDVLARGTLIAPGIVLAPLEAVRGPRAMLAVVRGQARAIEGWLSVDEAAGIALFRIDEPLAPRTMPASSSGQGDVRVAVGTAERSVAGPVVMALFARTDLSAPATRLGPNVRRNLAISGALFGLLALAFALPPLLLRLRARRRVGREMRAVRSLRVRKPTDTDVH